MSALTGTGRGGSSWGQGADTELREHTLSLLPPRGAQILQGLSASQPVALPSEARYLTVPSLGAAWLRGSSSTNILTGKGNSILAGTGTRNRVRESRGRNICHRVGESVGQRRLLSLPPPAAQVSGLLLREEAHTDLSDLLWNLSKTNLTPDPLE